MRHWRSVRPSLATSGIGQVRSDSGTFSAVLQPAAGLVAVWIERTCW